LTLANICTYIDNEAMTEIRRFDFSDNRVELKKHDKAITRLGAEAMRHASHVEQLSALIKDETGRLDAITGRGQLRSDTADASIRALIESLKPELQGNSFSISGKLYGKVDSEELRWTDLNPVDVTAVPVRVTDVFNPQQNVNWGPVAEISRRLYWGSPDLGPARSRRFERPLFTYPSAARLGVSYNPHSLYPDVDPVVILELDDEARQLAGLATGDVKEKYGYWADLVFARLEEVELTPLSSKE
jgi:hypothetical protein